MNNWILQKVVQATTQEGFDHYIATYHNGFKEIDEFFEVGYKIPTIIKVEDFGKIHIINDKL